MNNQIDSNNFYKLNLDPLNIEICKNAPFYEELYDIFNSNRTNEKGKSDIILPSHATYVVKFAEDLIGEDYSLLLKSDQDTNRFINLKKSIFSNFDSNLLNKGNSEFLKIAALFHDIGKYIEVDNHPQIGLYLIRDFFPSKRQELIDSIGMELFALLCSVIQHHDKFGVSQTGEASLSVFADIPYHASCYETIKGVKRNFSFVCMCNLMDIAASGHIVSNKFKPIQLSTRTINLVTDDWKILMQAIEESKGERENLIKILVDEDRKSHRVINRIERLLKSSTVHLKRIQETIDIDYLTIMVPMTLQSNFDEFANGFAHIVKLDYGLRFFRILSKEIAMRYIDKSCLMGVSKEKQDSKIESEINVLSQRNIDQIRDQITIKILKVLERFVLRYRWLLVNKSGDEYRRIGYEMRGVLGDEKLTKAMINSLIAIESEPAALNWITDKTPIWSFD